MTTKQIKEQEKKQMLMATLGCTEEEALDIIKIDDMIDHNQRTPYDLSPEEEKEAKRIGLKNSRKAHNQETNMRGKVRAENPTKSGIIASLFNFLNENDEILLENVQILNKERQIAFKCGENDFELTLVQKRTKKK